MIRPSVTLTANPEFVAAVALVLKVSLVLIGGTIVAALLHKRPAAARHLVWVLASIGALALAAIAPVAPNVSLHLVDWAPSPAAAVTSQSFTASGGSESASLASTTANSGAGDHGITAADSPASPNSASVSTALFASPLAIWSRTHPGAAVLAAIWLAGSVGVLFWIFLGHVGLARLARSATPAFGADWSALLAEAAKRNGVTRAVRLGMSENAGGPVTWGWLHPVILFPTAAAAWPAEQKRAALMHEMAHVARYDYLTQLLASIACGVYWFHPLAWNAARRLRSESELACDDRVLAGGTAPTDYATQLLGVARQARELRLGGFVAVSMARPSHLEGRLLAVLDSGRPRGAPSSRMRLAATTGFAMILIPFAGLRPAPLASAAPSSVVASSEQTSTRTFSSVSDSRVPVAALPVSEAAEGLVVADRERGESPAETTRLSEQGQSALQESAEPFVPDSSFEKSEKAAPGELLFLDLLTGGSVEVRGTDEAMVRVRVQLGGRDWEETRVEVGRTEDGVRVRSAQERRTGSYSTSHKFVISVPPRFDVRLKSSGGSLTIVGVEGTFRGNTGGGELVLERATGRANLSTGGGDIEVSDSDLSGSVSTGGGMVKLSRVRGGLRGSSGSGPVIYGDGSDDAKKNEMDELHGDLRGVTVNEGRETIQDARATGSGMLHVRKAGGPIALGEAPYGATISTGGGDIRVGRGAGMVDAHTGGGEIEIGPVAGSVRASTGAGKVSVTLIDAQGAEQSVEIKSGTGSVVIELPASFDGVFELETAYTRTFGRATQIESPWVLQREETTGWESDYGTPRRFVRARGVAGKGGRGLIRVNTVNGDIILRRGEP
ncbi:MAG: M56 family metallopeptidase [Anaerolineae bacterium]|nr:M56 family metallopeptidase [Gemmatimonadaceae bacterium]